MIKFILAFLFFTQTSFAQISSGTTDVNVLGGSLTLSGTSTVSGTVAVSNSSFGIAGSLPAGTNALGSITNTVFGSTQSGSWNVGLTGGTNGLALEAGHLASMDATLALIKTKTDNIDVALSTRTKPADTQNISGSVSISGTPNVNVSNASIAVTAASLPLPTGGSTSALQTTGNASLTTIAANTPALGQAAASASSPVVLPAAQITALTPPTTVTVTQPTGTNLHTVIDSGTVTTTISGTPNVNVTNSSIPVTGAVTANIGTTNGLALESGHAASTDTSTAAINSKITTTANGIKVDGTGATQPVSIVGTPSVSVSNLPATQAISAASLPLPTGAAADSSLTTLNTSVNTLLKPASTLAAVTNVGSVTSITNPVSISGTVPVSGSLGRSWTSASSTDSTSAVVTSMPAITGTVTANIGTVGTLATDTSVNSLLKPASTLAAVTTLGSVTNTVTVKADTPANQANALKVDGTATTQPVSIAGTVNTSGTVTANIGTTNGLALEAGHAASTDISTAAINTKVSTAANQATEISSLATIVTNTAATVTALNAALPAGTNSIGQVTTNAGTNTSTAALNLETTQAAISAKIPPLGQAAMISSTPVVIASNQTAIPVNFSGSAFPTYDASTAALAANATYTTPSFDGSTGNTYLSYSAFSATQLSIIFQESSDNINWSSTDSYTVAAGASNYSAHKMSARYGRVVYTNSSISNSGGIANLNLLTSLSNHASETDVSIVDSIGQPISSVSGGTNTINLAVAQSATNFAFSTLNSSTTQLAAGATFNGTIETAQNQQSASVLLTSDQNGTLVFNEYIDAAGTRISRTATYSIIANIPYSRSFVVNGNYFKASFTNNGASATTTFNLNTAYGTIPSATALGNGQVSLDEVNGTAFSLQNGALPVTRSNSLLKTYSAQSPAIIPVAAAQDIFYISGSATKTIRVLRMGISATQTVAGVVPLLINKRSTANTGGTPTTATNVPNDSSFPAATATVISNTGSVTGGTLVGSIKSMKMFVPATATAVPTNQTIFEFTDSPIVLRGTGQLLSVNLNSATVTGGSYSIWVEWSEE